MSDQRKWEKRVHVRLSYDEAMVLRERGQIVRVCGHETGCWVLAPEEREVARCHTNLATPS